MREKGILIVVSGFSGSGKGTIMKELLKQYDNYALSISATTRNPRPGEVDGREYFFETKEQFENLQKYTDKIIKQISQEILSGNIDIKPYYNTKDKKTPCEYCSYKSICRFDEGQCNNYNYVGKLNREAVLEEIKSRIGD